MYYPYLYTYTCTAVLSMLYLELSCTCLYGCAMCRAYVGMYGCAVCKACVKMYGPAACAVLCICMYSCAVYWACVKMRIFYGLQKCSLALSHTQSRALQCVLLCRVYILILNRFLTLLEIVGGTPLTLSPYFTKKKGKKKS